MADTNEIFPAEDAALIWKPVKVEHLIQDKWIDFRRVRYQLPDGTEFGPYYNYSRRSYVVILASDTDGNFLCVRQYRHGIGKVTTEFPAGGIERSGGYEYVTKEDKASDAENALDAAKRELREETGYVSDEWTHLITIPSNPTISDNYAFIFIAENCRKEGDPKPDATEFLQLRLLSPAQIDQLIHAGEFPQPDHVMAWYMRKCGEGVSYQTDCADRREYL